MISIRTCFESLIWLMSLSPFRTRMRCLRTNRIKAIMAAMIMMPLLIARPTIKPIAGGDESNGEGVNGVVEGSMESVGREPALLVLEAVLLRVGK